MKQLYTSLLLLVLLSACHNGQGSSNKDTTTNYPPAVLNDTANSNAGNGTPNASEGDTLKNLQSPKHTPPMGDTASKNNAQNTGIVKDTAAKKHK